MHRYRIAARISLICSIINLVLAAPVAVQGIHEARMDDTKAITSGSGDVAAAPKKSGELEITSDRPESPPPGPSHDVEEPQALQHSSLLGGSTSSDHSPYLSSDESVSGYSWIAERPPRLSLNSDIPSSSNVPALSVSESSSSSAPSHITPEWLRQMEYAILLHFGPDGASATNSPAEKFTSSYHGSSSSLATTAPSTQYSSASDGSLTSHYFTASEGPPTPPPENAKFFNENMVKKIKIAAGVTAVGSVVAGIVGLHLKHKHRDYKDS